MRRAKALPPSVPNKKPKQNPQPTGRGGVNKGKGNLSGQYAKKREKAVEQKGREVHDIRTLACMKAPGVPPLLSRVSDQSPEKIAGRLSKLSGPLCHAHRTVWVQDPLCNTAPTDISGTGGHIPQGVPKVVVSESVSVRAAEQGSD